ncbi:hypothetical protein CIG19_21185 [Enterobacterales bacterium CwR94]|nr:hypothetical protein CIG19_21185 [Enterobacterales bacterium CwR94]
MKRTLLAIFALALSGCSTTPVSVNMAKEVNASPTFKMVNGGVPLTIVRDRGFVAGGCAITAFINGEKVASLETGQKVTVYISPGDITVGAGFIGAGLCSGPPKRERDFTVKIQTPKTLRIFLDQSANVDILPTTN